MADVVVTAASVAIKTVNSRATSGTGGETLTAGKFVYLDSNTNRYKGAINSTESAAECKGLVTDPTADGDFAAVYSGTGIVVDLGATLTEGTWYTISSTAGNIHPYADLVSTEWLSWVGYGNADGDLVMYLINTGTQKS